VHELQYPRTYQIELTWLSVDFVGADMMLSLRIGQIVDQRDNANRCTGILR
jgi:hypothetical protein